MNCFPATKGALLIFLHTKKTFSTLKTQEKTRSVSRLVLFIFRGNDAVGIYEYLLSLPVFARVSVILVILGTHTNFLAHHEEKC